MKIKMQEYIGIRTVQAKKMTRGEFNEEYQKKNPLSGNPEEEGYLVLVRQGFGFWQKKEEFEPHFILNDNDISILDIKSALETKPAELTKLKEVR
jgi:hypothetical protein